MKQALRRLAELVMGPIVVLRRLPASSGGGRLAVSARVGGLKYLLKPADRWDPELLEVASLVIRTNDVIWDVGANVGLFSRAAAARAGPRGRVISIEADVDAVMLLNRTCRLTDKDQAEITVLPVAVGKDGGIARFAIAKRARAANAIEGFGSTQTGGVREVRTLPCVTLDSLLIHFPAPQVLKIDVEGAELGVLQGAAAMLAKARPVIYCEVYRDSSREVTELLRANQYQLFKYNNASHARLIELDEAAYNTLAIPQDKVSLYQTK
jgi:FkbM family methyltransferase